MNHQVKKGATLLAGTTDPHCQGEIGGSCTVVARKTVSESQRILWGPSWYLHIPNRTGELKTMMMQKKGSMTEDSNLLGMTVWVTPQPTWQMFWLRPREYGVSW